MSYIHYVVQLRKGEKDVIKPLIDFISKFNAMIPAYTNQQGL